MKKYILSMDQGTTSSRAILFDRAGRICAMAQKEFRQYYPKPGWVEHDAAEIWRSMLEVAREVVSGVGAEKIAVIGIANQRETTVIWDRATGKPIAPAIVWQCRRTAPIIDELVRAGHADMIRRKTGLIPDAYYSGSKITWLLDNTEGAREKAERGELLFGTIDCWLIWNLTGGRVHATDATNASRTMLCDIHAVRWDEELLSLLRVPASMMPEIRPSTGSFGECDLSVFGAPIPIAGAAGDQQCALFGQRCFSPGEMKNTYGTGCFLLMNTGTKAAESTHGLVTTIAAAYPDHVDYALEGSVFVAGAAIQWLRDELGLIVTSPESEALAASVPDTAGVTVVPAFTGMGAPYWNQNARGMITGLTRGANRAHLVRATLESLAFQSRDIAEAMSKDAGVEITSLRVDGGASRNNLLMRFQADLLGCETVRPKNVETTALGAAYLAGLASGFWKDKDELRTIWERDAVFTPRMTAEEREKRLKEWRRAVRCALAWAKEDDE